MSPTITEWIADLTAKGDAPCDGARRWLATLPAGATMSDAWAQCRRSDWMQWAAQRSPLKETDERWRMAACATIRRIKVRGEETTWDLATDQRSRNTVEVAERFSRGEATSGELAAAAVDAAAAYAYAAYASYNASAWAVWAAVAYASAAASYNASAWAVWAAVYAASAAASAWAVWAAASAVLREFIPDPWATQTAGPGKEEG